MSLWDAASGGAGGLAPGLGSFLGDRFGWPWAFFLNLALGMTRFWRGWRILDESRDPERGAPIGVTGAVLLILGVGWIPSGLVVRRMGSVLGVALTVAITAHTMLNLAKFRTISYLQIALGLATAILCAPVDTRSRTPQPC